MTFEDWWERIDHIVLSVIDAETDEELFERTFRPEDFPEAIDISDFAEAVVAETGMHSDRDDYYEPERHHYCFAAFEAIDDDSGEYTDSLEPEDVFSEIHVAVQKALKAKKEDVLSEAE